ncbi:MAG: leucine-rich repeat protein [Bacteroidaceae bacterium]|nr:leucine-rich repeat protein [Bacteroidaceae bacterium]
MSTTIKTPIPDKRTSWEDYAGERVEDWIKGQLESKAGCFYYDGSQNKYLVFADAENRDLYLEDSQTYSSLLITAFDAPANYLLSIELSTPVSNAVLTGATGSYVTFTPRVEDKNGNAVSENVNITYTFRRGSSLQTLHAVGQSGVQVSVNIDQYLQSGTNNITIQCTGQTTLSASMASVQYIVVDLSLTDSFDISRPVTPTGTLSIPYTVSGSGTKKMEWYIDGTKQAENQSEDEVTYTTETRTKNITLNSLTEGRHHLQFRAKVTIGGQDFHSRTLYREFVVVKSSGSSLSSAVMVCKGELSPGVTVTSGQWMTHVLTQYVPYDFVLAVWNPSSNSTTVSLKVGGSTYDGSLPTLSTLSIANGVETTYSYTPTSCVATCLWLVSGDVRRKLDLTIGETDMSLAEITNGLDFNFDARGRSNSESRHEFSFSNANGTTYNGSFDGFDWNDSSGWNDDALLINQGSKFYVSNFKPFTSGMTQDGYTLELEFATENVSDDDAAVCDMGGVDREGYMSAPGMYISATSAGVSCDTWLGSSDKESRALRVRFRDGEYIRIAFVLNRLSGSNDAGLLFVYINGRLSGAKPYTSVSSFAQNKYLKFESSGCDIRLRYVRCYRTALSADQVLNNYILYRHTLTEMKEVYDRNDVYDQDNRLNRDKLANAMPVMCVTGPLQDLENTTDKKLLRQVSEIVYTNLQDPALSFRMTNVGMTPQGTSSMSYPKKNFRIYTKKYYSEGKLFDSAGNEVTDRLYSFKRGSIPVAVWCLKADYAESSSSHNTGVARLWNDVMKNAKVTFDASETSSPTNSVSDAYALRTKAQVQALANNYPYDVRTCIDGFPIMLFYRPTAEAEYIFMGKYNFNNDKSTENVFGFKDIPGFDNTHMQCWEVLNNGNAIALFNTVSNFAEGWKDAFEGRYPDGSTAVSDLQVFCTWVSGVTEERFASEKWAHLDVYKVAAYYVYLMLFGAVDQTTKNAMLTSEDGQHFFYINYDNDTILGVRNDGVLAFPPTIDRQSEDRTTTTEGVYAYAGHDNKLWNLCEEDPEFKAIVRVVYGALYEAGLNYQNCIDIFDAKQSMAWCERIFNLDADYKYLTPYRSGTNNLAMLQGSRSSHRRWWLSQRFALYDAKFVGGEYRDRMFEFKVQTGTPAGQKFTIKAGRTFSYGYGSNAVVYESGVSIAKNGTHEFETSAALNIGDPVRIYGGYYLKGVDLHKLAGQLATVDLTNIQSLSLGNMLEELVIGNSNADCSITGISALNVAKKLTKLDVRRCVNMTSLDLTENVNVATLYAGGSHLSSVDFAEGSKIALFEVPKTLGTLTLRDAANAALSAFTYEQYNGNSYGCFIGTIDIRGCKKSTMKNSWAWVKNWWTYKTTAQKNAATYYQDNIAWTNVPCADLITLKQGMGNRLTLLGEINLSDETITSEQAQTLQTLFGQDCFSSTADLQIKPKNAIMYFTGDTSMVEGDGEHTITFNVISTASGRLRIITNTNSHSNVTFNPSSVDTTSAKTASIVVSATEASGSAYDITLSAYWTPSGGSTVGPITHTISVAKATYPTISQITSINGSSRLNTTGNRKTNFSITPTIETLKQTYTGTFGGRWSLSGDAASYATIDSNNSNCVITVNSNISVEYAVGTLTFTLWKHPSGGSESVIGTKTMDVAILSNNLAVSQITNAPLMNFLWSKFGNGVSGSRPYNSNGNYLLHETYITKDEAEAFEYDSAHTTSTWSSGYGFVNGTSVTTGFFYSIRSTLTHFDEFQYFTGVTVIPEFFLCNCTKLEEFEFHDNLTEIKQYGLCLVNNGSTTTAGLCGEITLPIGIDTIGHRAFGGNGRMTKITGLNVQTMGVGVFMYCTNLTEIYMPILTTCSGEVCTACPNIAKINFPRITSWAGYGFAGYNGSVATNVEHPEVIVGSLSPSNYYWSRSLSVKWKLTLSEYCTSIGDNLRVNDGEIPFTELDVDENNTTFTIMNGCIVNMQTNKLEMIPNSPNVILPSGIDSVVSSSTVNKRYHITSLTIPSSYSSLGSGWCMPNADLVLDSDNQTYEGGGNNVLILSSTKQVVASFKNPSIPSGVLSIANSAFRNNTGVVNISIPNTVTYIGTEAFSGCTNLQAITVPESVNASQNYSNCFNGCTSLTTATIYAKNLGDSWFNNCTALETVVIGTQCTRIGTRAFQGATYLSQITLAPTTKPSWGTTPFGSGNATAGYNTRTTGNNKLKVPASLSSSYASDSVLTANLLNASYGGFTLDATL